MMSCSSTVSIPVAHLYCKHTQTPNLIWSFDLRNESPVKVRVCVCVCAPARAAECVPVRLCVRVSVFARAFDTQLS